MIDVKSDWYSVARNVYRRRKPGFKIFTEVIQEIIEDMKFMNRLTSIPKNILKKIRIPDTYKIQCTPNNE